jgi:hypothetical protein
MDSPLDYLSVLPSVAAVISAFIAFSRNFLKTTRLPRYCWSSPLAF